MRATPPTLYKAQTLERGLLLLETLAGAEKPLSLSNISKLSGLQIATTHRLLNVLKRCGYVRQNPNTQCYHLSLKIFELGSFVLKKLNLRQEAGPILQKLAHETRDSAFLVMRDEDEALCLTRIDGSRYVRVLFLQEGMRMPLYMGGAPQALLASLADDEIDQYLNRVDLSAWTPKTLNSPEKIKKEIQIIRSRGYAISMEDVTPGVAAVGCPVVGPEGKANLAISLCGLSTNYNRKNIGKIAKKIMRAAAEISSCLANTASH